MQSYEAMKGMFRAFRVNDFRKQPVSFSGCSIRPGLRCTGICTIITSGLQLHIYAARNANQPIQLIYNYGNNSIYAVNETRQEVKNFNTEIKLLNTGSKVLTNKNLIVDIPSNSSVKIMQLDPLTENEFLSMKLTDANGKRVAGNFYWLSDKPDEFAWDKTNWVFTPLKSFADHTPLSELQPTKIAIV
ncbi:MAG: hypothetical protein U0Z17_05760 [Bacteroidales bacterium]